MTEPGRAPRRDAAQPPALTPAIGPGKASAYDIGPFRLDISAHVLTRDGTPLALGARAVDVLHALVAHANEPMSKAQLIEAAWPGLVVEENNLAVQIWAIRRALAVVPGADGWIETLARRGYRFVGPVPCVDIPRAPRSSSSLGAPATTFIGRESEIAEITRLLPTTRLLTFVGPGGVGKTRLATHAVNEVAAAYPDGVFIVELGAISDAALVPAAVAQSLGVSERDEQALPQTLAALLHSRKVLLVIDNCEHLLAACRTLLNRLLRETSQVAFLATSREPLRIDDECVLQVPALALAAADASPEAVADAEAVRLFVDRVRRVQPGFALTPERAPLVAELCRRLDGMPLALEFAAARARALSVEQIHARLNERFRLLTSLSPAPTRQQTLRTTLDWSYDLLAEAERIVLRRISIFPGTFTFEAAVAVAGDQAIDAHALVDIVGQLVARSLVVAEAAEGAVRYRLLETTRSYAAEKLAEAGEDKPLCRVHAMHFRDHFVSAPHDWMRMSDAAWRARYSLELDNVRAALDWALSPEGDPQLAITLAGRSGPLWSTRSLWGEGLRRLRSAATHVAASPARAADEARLWLSLGLLHHDASPAAALDALDRAERLYATLDDPVALVDTRRRRGRALAQMGRYEEARTILSATQPLAKASGLPKLIGFHFVDRALAAIFAGELDEALDCYTRSLVYLARAGATLAVTTTTGNLAEVKWALGDIDGALAGFRENVAMLRASPSPRASSLGFSLFNLAGVKVERGDLDEALMTAREALRLLTPAMSWVFADHLALRAVLGGDVERGARLAGFADAGYAARGSARQPNEARAHARLTALLEAKVEAPVLAGLRAEGAALSDERAWGLALER